jgi:hypothetical protein
LKLVINDKRWGANNKVSNMANAIEMAKYSIYVLADSDVYVGENYLKKILEPFEDEAVGMVTTMYRTQPRCWMAAFEALSTSTEFFPSVLLARQLEGMAFAFGARSLVLDINIRRLFARLYDGVQSPTASATKQEKARYEALIPAKDAHIWAAATMELGALVCTSQSPKCGICPVAKVCTWRSLDYPQSDVVKRRQTWHGTDRQCRGAIVQALRENELLKKSEIAQLWDVPSQLEKALITLLDDGLIEARGKSGYSLPRT